MALPGRRNSSKPGKGKPEKNLRAPAVAGFFYPDRKETLVDLLGRLAAPGREKQRALAAVVPHGSLFSCGSVAAAVYGRLSGFSAAVIVGPNHSRAGEPVSVAADGEWVTPLGRLPVDKALARALIKAVPGLKKDSKAHAQEHSAEVQLPFLQKWLGLRGFVPVALAGTDLETARQIGKGLAAALERAGRETLLIAYANLSRYEPREKVERQDQLLIDRITALDERGLMEEEGSWCGAPAVAAVLAAAKELGASGARLVKYEINGAIEEPGAAVSGYAGILVQ